MSKVAIVTDSTGYIPKELVEEYNITVVPLYVIWDGEQLKDDVDITPTAFYNRLTTSKTMPSTSQPTPADFQAEFTRLHKEGYDILSILISSGLSGTVDSAQQAKQAMPEANIVVFDSRSTAMELGFHTLAAARAAAEGKSLDECVAAAEKARQNSGIIFAVDTLEFLHRGGRIGGASRYLGTLLRFKPLLTVTKEGKIDALEKVRTKKKAQKRVSDIVVEQLQGKPGVRLATLNANAPEEAQALLEYTRGRLDDVVETIFSEVSPVIGTHVGPGTVGLAYTHD